MSSGHTALHASHARQVQRGTPSCCFLNVLYTRFRPPRASSSTFVTGHTVWHFPHWKHSFRRYSYVLYGRRSPTYPAMMEKTGRAKTECMFGTITTSVAYAGPGL